jgi:CheY-like chemotaxis protein
LRFPGTKAVLVVDDDRDSRDVVADYLTYHGHVVVTSASGRDAFRKLAHGDLEPDVIILDLAMPGMDGTSFVEALKKDERLARIPIVIISAFGEAEAPSPKGVVARFRKPVDLQALVQHFVANASELR